MNCADCGEHIGETERRGAHTCCGCKALLHAECAVYSEQEDPFCEPCHGRDAVAWRLAMKAKGAEA